jgi:DNA polymerase elongation subunit (family B)
MSQPKIILFDIETMPDFKEVIKIWCGLSNFPGRTLKATICSVLCVSWKELDSKRTHCINAWDFDSWDNDINDDYAVCKAIHEVMSEADVVVTHNGKRFDWKFLQTRFLKHDLGLLPKIIHVDTCQLAKSNLLSYSNSLGYLNEWLGGDTKLDNGGWNLWVRVSKRIKSAQKLMTKYCKQDVVVLEELFHKLRPFAKNLPNRNMGRTGKQKDKFPLVCASCGSADLKPWGHYYTKTTKFRRLICLSCNSWNRVDAKEKNPRAC